MIRRNHDVTQKPLQLNTKEMQRNKFETAKTKTIQTKAYRKSQLYHPSVFRVAFGFESFEAKLHCKCNSERDCCVNVLCCIVHWLSWLISKFIGDLNKLLVKFYWKEYLFNLEQWRKFHYYLIEIMERI